MKNVGNSSRGRSQGVPKIFRAPMCRAHCAVIFAIAQLSCCYGCDHADDDCDDDDDKDDDLLSSSLSYYLDQVTCRLNMLEESMKTHHTEPAKQSVVTINERIRNRNCAINLIESQLIIRPSTVTRILHSV